MADVYEQYENNKTSMKSGDGVRYTAMSDRIEAALDQTELLKEVRARVEAFVEAYEQLNALSMEEVRKLRAREVLTDRGRAIADNIEREHQQLYTQGHAGTSGFTALILDDLKILLDQFPQQP